ncbi:MAG: TRAP transporter fused permease subunit [Alphaproteobacteria bacterium]|nr:TRAP transporter fused permease subunit [Alphaproteobacteria bacterium]MBU0796755.1 TRAP transporter fused permease subunit [Alphaproteobacteria bacterium]MBU0888281.1 TRAP transporter fused permease subunit [Alphaproteobacteria bacterium]MBU1811482.1 TRAP transporter fused permease subunit [Alphaproteobacteria bacterium]
MSIWTSRIARCFVPDETPHAGLIIVAGLLSIAFVLVHVFQLSTYFLPSGEFKVVHIAGGIALTFLALAVKDGTGRLERWHFVLLALLTLFPLGYILIEHDAIATQRQFMVSSNDIAVAVLFLALALYAAWREWGLIMSGLAIATLLYGYYGYLVPGELFFHAGIGLQRLIGYTSIPYFQGLLGGLAELSAGTIFPFMLFAAALEMTGCVDYIMGTAYRVGGKTRAGPAQIAVIGSGLMGMVSGSSVANVASTGALTIPLMKRFGFKPEFAGAVEAVASTGGQITPPIMGLAAFLIVGITGIPYVEIVKAAVFPALIYYGYLMVAVHIRAIKRNIDVRDRAEELGKEFLPEPFLKATLRNLPFYIATTYLVVVLISGMSPGAIAIEATGILIGLSILRDWVINWDGVTGRLVHTAQLLGRIAYSGALRGAQVAIVVAVIGVLVDILVVTGFAQKLSFAMLDMAGGELWPLLLIAAVSCLAFGLGLPTSAAYILVALLGAPALIQVGVPLLAAHMFVFYFANISSITPPVAVASLIAAKIAGASYFRTGFIGMRLGLPGFLLPFLFAIHPEILGIDSTLPYVAMVSAMAFVGVVSVNLILEGHFLLPLNWLQRALLLPAAAGLLMPGLTSSAIGLCFFALVAGWQYVDSKRQERAAA